jgi:hypothetical protein
LFRVHIKQTKLSQEWKMMKKSCTITYFSV